MATTKLLLQQPYKVVPKKDKADDQQGQSALNGTKTGKKFNPYETRLYCFLIIGRDQVIKLKTEYVIFPKEWNFSKQCKKETLAGSIEFNKKLTALKNDIWDKYKSITEQFPDLPFPQVSRTLKEYGKGKEIPFLNHGKDLFQVLDEFILSMEGEAAPGTIKKFITLKNSLLELGKVNKKYETLSFSMIDHSFKDAFIKYLHNQKPRGRQKSRPEGDQYGLLTDTVGKYVECLKTFLKWAQERNYNRYGTYKEFSNFTKANLKRKKQGHDIVTLSLAELRQFYTFDFSDRPSLDRVRDLFCFGAYTGQRWSDIERFDKNQLDGDVWRFNAYKTKKETEIDLIGFAAPAMDILKKYEYQLPKISLQKFNLYLKDAAKVAGIDSMVKIRRYVGDKEIEISKPKCDFLGSHTARKTCVSILLNNYNMNVTHVLQITGHSDLKTLQKYINTDRTARRDAISRTKSITETLTVVKAG